MADKKLVYCQHMVYLCNTQATEWGKIASDLSAMLARARGSRMTPIAAEVQVNAPERAAERNAPAPGPAAAPREDPNRMRMQVRIAHAFRGLILVFALGLPRVFYYIYGVYSILVLSGAADRIRSAEFRALFTGSRPSLDIQLARLRSRQEGLERLEELQRALARGEVVDEEQLAREQEFMAQFKPARPWVYRFVYQSGVMFLYTLFPSCHPHAEYLT